MQQTRELHFRTISTQLGPGFFGQVLRTNSLLTVCMDRVGIDQIGTFMQSSTSGMGFINNGNNKTRSAHMYM